MSNVREGYGKFRNTSNCGLFVFEIHWQWMQKLMVSFTRLKVVSQIDLYSLTLYMDFFLASGNFCRLVQPVQTVWTLIRADLMLVLILI